MKYQNIDTLEVKRYGELRDAHKGSFPKVGAALIADKWKLVDKTEMPVPENEITHGVREADPVDFAEAFEIYELPAEESAALQKAADILAISEIHSEFLAESAAIKEGYSEDEIKTWDTQLVEAKIHSGLLPGSTPLLDAIVAESGEDKTELANKIIENAGLFKHAMGGAIGRKRKKEKTHKH